MPVFAEDLIAPAGAVPDSLLVEIGSARAVVVTSPAQIAQGYVDAAERAASARTWTLVARRDRAVKAYATAAAFSERAGQILAAAMSVSGDRAGSVGYSTSQADSLERHAAAWRAAYDREVAAEVAATTLAGGAAPGRTRSVPTRFAW